jgi:hypothetical protein
MDPQEITEELGHPGALTGTHDGKQAVGELWGQLMSKGFRTSPAPPRAPSAPPCPPGLRRRNSPMAVVAPHPDGPRLEVNVAPPKRQEFPPP